VSIRVISPCNCGDHLAFREAISAKFEECLVDKTIRHMSIKVTPSHLVACTQLLPIWRSGHREGAGLNTAVKWIFGIHEPSFDWTFGEN